MEQQQGARLEMRTPEESWEKEKDTPNITGARNGQNRRLGRTSETVVSDLPAIVVSLWALPIK